MDLKDLRKWVEDYELIIKVRYAPNSGCEVRVHKHGQGDPFAMVVREDCVDAITEMHYLLQGMLERFGGFDGSAISV